MSDQIKTYYCDAQIVSTVTLKTRARNTDEALDKFQNDQCEALDRLHWVGRPKAFLNVRLTPKVQPEHIRESFETLEDEMKGEGRE